MSCLGEEHLIELSWPLAPLHSLRYRLTLPLRTLPNLLRDKRSAALVVSGGTKYFRTLPEVNLIVSAAICFVFNLDLALKEYNIRLLQPVGAALRDSAVFDLLLDSIPHVDRDIRNIDLFGELHDYWE